MHPPKKKKEEKRKNKRRRFCEGQKADFESDIDISLTAYVSIRQYIRPVTLAVKPKEAIGPGWRRLTAQSIVRDKKYR